MLKASAEAEAETRAWIAIMVVTNNCTRQVLGLPIFRTGVRLTSRKVVVALRAVLPPAFLISDPGNHFH